MLIQIAHPIQMKLSCSQFKLLQGGPVGKAAPLVGMHPVVPVVEAWTDQHSIKHKIATDSQLEFDAWVEEAMTCPNCAFSVAV